MATRPHRRWAATRRRALMLVTVAAAAAGLPLTIGTGTAHAASPPGYAFLWAEQPTAPYYAPSRSYQDNSTGGLNSVRRDGVGDYLVFLPGLQGVGGNVQVSAYGSGNARCKVAYWAEAGENQSVRVRCFAPSGAAADSTFTLGYQSSAGIGTSTTEHAYLWANDPSASSYTPSPDYSYNSRGAANRVQRLSTGRYVVTLGGMAGLTGNVQVTAYGSDTHHCKAHSWAFQDTVSVDCYNRLGVRTDALFSLNWTAWLSYPSGRRHAQAYADQPSNTAWYNTATFHSFNAFLSGTAGNPQARKVGTGTYEVYLPQAPAADRTLALVTAYGSGNGNACRPVAWHPAWDAGFNGTTVTVRCHTPGGSPADTTFGLSYLTNR